MHRPDAEKLFLFFSAPSSISSTRIRITIKAKSQNNLRLLWITPLRALAKDIGRAMEEVIAELEMQWKIGIRNGDTEMSERQKQKRQMPEVLIITPESLHLLLAQKDYPEIFQISSLNGGG